MHGIFLAFFAHALATIHIFLLLLAYDTYQILSKNLENELFVKLFHKTISQTSSCELSDHLVDASIKFVKYLNSNWCIDLHITPYTFSNFE
jgi:hypothetical protein